jgi:hypothetical protein
MIIGPIKAEARPVGTIVGPMKGKARPVGKAAALCTACLDLLLVLGFRCSW